MAINIPSLQAKLLNIAHQKGLDFQLMLNRFGAEQFLARLSQSTFVDQFVFKGGSLLAYLVDTERKTKDLDFSLWQISHQVEEVKQAIQEILSIPLEDGITWKKIEGSSLNHPDMELPGVRVFCHFLLGKMKGRVQMDMAMNEVPEAMKTALPRIRYKGAPLMGPDFSLWTYPKEKIFAEKFQIAFTKAETNTRMRD